MNTTRFHRQLDVLDLDKTSIPITVIGAGATGSFSVLTLAKMGFTNITAYDFDVVAEHNLPNQFYRTQDIGKPKVEALREIVREFEGIEITARNERYKGQRLKGIVLDCVDSMDVRIQVWNFVRNNPEVVLYIDSRMGLEVMQVYCVNPSDPWHVKSYESTLFPSSEAIPVRCTAKSIMYTVLAVASLLASTVKKVVMHEQVKHSLTFDLKTVTLIE